MSQQKHFVFRIVPHVDVGNIEFGLLRDGITSWGGTNSCRSIENSQRKKGCVNLSESIFMAVQCREK
jgi:hypothetical protein